MAKHCPTHAWSGLARYGIARMAGTVIGGGGVASNSGGIWTVSLNGATLVG